MNLEPDERDRDHLYKSADLTGKLLIFESIEQSRLDPIDFCNYIAGLTRQDGVKVLVVADDPESADETAYTTLLKEKILSDVIRYEIDYSLIVRDVLSKYRHPVLEQFSTEADIQEIEQCFRDHGVNNIHAFFFACQKTVDIYRLIDTDNAAYDPDFLKSVFMGILNFSLRKAAGEAAEWEDEDQLSFRLGGKEYPLFRFCYTYMMAQVYEPAQVLKAQEVLKEFRLYDRSPRPDDPDLAALYTWYYQKEQDLKNTVERISERLLDPAAFALREYGKIARCLLNVTSLLRCDISSAEKRLISNLTAKGMEVNSDFITRELVPGRSDPETADECADLRKRMLDALKKVDTELFGFSYQPSEIDAFVRKVPEVRERMLKFGAFASALDNSQIQSMLKQCTARQIYDFHTTYISVYRFRNSSAYLSGDKASIEELSALLKELESFEGYDRIQRKNLQDFIRELDEIDLKL